MNNHCQNSGKPSSLPPSLLETAPRCGDRRESVVRTRDLSGPAVGRIATERYQMTELSALPEPLTAARAGDSPGSNPVSPAQRAHLSALPKPSQERKD